MTRYEIHRTAMEFIKQSVKCTRNPYGALNWINLEMADGTTINIKRKGGFTDFSRDLPLSHGRIQSSTITNRYEPCCSFYVKLLMITRAPDGVYSAFDISFTSATASLTARIAIASAVTNCGILDLTQIYLDL